jgi:hypothetical protein
VIVEGADRAVESLARCAVVGVLDQEHGVAGSDTETNSELPREPRR